jgi:superfamily II RNA helicase
VVIGEVAVKRPAPSGCYDRPTPVSSSSSSHAPPALTLADRVPPRRGAEPDELLDLFLGHVRSIGLDLYPAQEQALLELFAGNNVILATPTGSGKSLVALALHFLAFSQGRRSFYTAPIKALVSEKFFGLCRDFGPDHVGMITGDASVNRDAPIICCTAEILSNLALREGKRAAVDCAVLDEFHYYADPARGVAWQVPLLVLENTQFLLMSATIGPTATFEKALARLTHKPAVAVRSSERPVPLRFEYRETHLHETIVELGRTGLLPVYVVNFTQRAAAETAQDLMSIDLVPKERKKAIAAELVNVRFDTPYGKEIKRFLAHGIGVHHAGLLPKYRLVVEKLTQKGLLAVVSGTDTLGVGVNIPIRTVLFTQLCKFDGQKTAILSARDFHQIAGRAGRRGFDMQGTVLAQAPEHVVENLRMEQKAAGDPGKLRRIVRKKPPDKGYVHWDRATFEKLVTSEPEALVSRFRVSHGMILSVLERPGAGCLDIGRIIYRSHERPAQKRIFGREAKSMLDALVAAGIVEVGGQDEAGAPTPRRIRLHVDLQDDFSLHHALSLWLVEAVASLDPESATHALDVLSIVESILENPDFVLRQQLDVIKRTKLAELKMAGVEYDQRMEELEKLDYPKPLAELVYESFNAFARAHPWVRGDDVRPKSVARDMVERFMDFNEYVREYELGRAEGTLLRYLTDAYKALVQTVPAPLKTPAIEEIEVFLRAIVRSADSSLLDEWDRLRTAEVAPAAVVAELGAPAALAEPDVTRDERGFTVLVRAFMFQLLRALAHKDYAGAAQMVHPDPADATGAGDDGLWTADRFARSFAPFFAEHAAIRLDPSARVPANTRITKTDRGGSGERSRERSAVWEVAQVIADDAGDDDWLLTAWVDMDASAREGKPIVIMRDVTP